MKNSKRLSLLAVSLLLAPAALAFTKTVNADESISASDTSQTTDSSEPVMNNEAPEEIPAVQEPVAPVVPEQEVPVPVEPEAPIETTPEEVPAPGNPGEVTDPGQETTDPEQEVTDPEQEVTDPEQETPDPEQEVTDPEPEPADPTPPTEEPTEPVEKPTEKPVVVPEQPKNPEPAKPTTPTPPVSTPAPQPNNQNSASNPVLIPSYTNNVPISAILPTNATSVQQAIVEKALQYLGIPYVWGGKTPAGFDCSGLVAHVYREATGREITGWTGTQQYAGTQIPVSQAQPGDLLFWGPSNGITSHVAIYIGNGQFIHAPQTGDVVKITNLVDFMPDFAVRIAASGLPGANGEINFQKNQSTDVFLEQIAESAREIGQTEGIYASVMLAQAILESGSGNSSLASAPNYNLFGIKGQHQGQSVVFNTLEQTASGSSYSIQAGFRKYPSYKESLEDYAKLIKDGLSGNPSFYRGTWKTETQSYMDATAYLQGRYATDVQYASKLNGIIKTYDLTQYDEPKEVEVPEEQAPVTPVVTETEVETETAEEAAEMHYLGYRIFRKEDVMSNPKLMRLVTPKKMIEGMKQNQSRNQQRTPERTKPTDTQAQVLSNGYVAIALDTFTAYLPK